jgi:hypothetical protein
MKAWQRFLCAVGLHDIEWGGPWRYLFHWGTCKRCGKVVTRNLIP